MQPGSEVARREIRLPFTGQRNYQSFSKLLSRVRRGGACPSGFEFEGKFLRSGMLVDEDELRPGAEYPPMPVLIEHAQVRVEAKPRNRVESVYVLWRLEGGVWMEIGRAQSNSWDWALDLGPMASRALAQAPVVEPDLAAIERRIRAALAQELEGLEAGDQWRVLGIIHDQLACRVVSASEKSLA